MAENDRIDALGAELRGAINSMAKEMRLGFQDSARAVGAIDKKLDTALYIGNGKRAIFRWLEDLQRWQETNDAQRDQRKKHGEATKRDTRDLVLSLVKEAFRSGLGLLVALWLAHNGGLF